MSADVQQTLLPRPEPPRALVEFLSGFAASWAFGDRPTAEERRQAARVGGELARRVCDLRAGVAG